MRDVVLASVGTRRSVCRAIQRSRVAAHRPAARGSHAASSTTWSRSRSASASELSERLHDGALQYVLAARLDLEDVRDGDHAGAVARIEHALGESSRMLRSTVSELHPAVLEQAGLAQAVRDLAASSRVAASWSIDVDIQAWPDGTHTPVDDLLFSAARELLSNVVRHAAATRAHDHAGPRQRVGDPDRHRRRHRHRRGRSRPEPLRRPHRAALTGPADRGGGRRAARQPGASGTVATVVVPLLEPV